MHGLAVALWIAGFSATVSVILLKWNDWHQTSLSCQLVNIFRFFWLKERFFAVGCVALPVTPRKDLVDRGRHPRLSGHWHNDGRQLRWE